MLDSLMDKKNKLRQKKSRLEVEEKKLREQEKKLKLKKQIQLGNLIFESGLQNKDPDILFGAFLELSEKLKTESQTQCQVWKNKAKNHRQKTDSQTKESLIVTIISKEETKIYEAKNVLKENRFRLNKFRNEWYGSAKKTDLEKALASYEFTIEEVV